MSATTTPATVADLLDRHAIFVQTRTGQKIHAQSPGSSVTYCGHWQKANGHFFEVAADDVTVGHLCERCFPQAAMHREALESAQANAEKLQRAQDTNEARRLLMAAEEALAAYLRAEDKALRGTQNQMPARRDAREMKLALSARYDLLSAIVDEAR